MSGALAPLFLVPSLYGCELLASRSGRFAVGERALHYQRIRGWVDPTAGMDTTQNGEKTNRLKNQDRKVARHSPHQVLGNLSEEHQQRQNVA
jgi:hypothetical protein